MKTVNSIPFIAIAILLMVNSGCTPERPSRNGCDTCQVGGGSGVVINTPPLVNHAPELHAPDKLVFYPTSFTNLSAGGSTWNIIQTFSWSKVSGPSSFLIETPNSLKTKVSNLQIGVYQFQLFVQDAAGLTEKDTCTVIVGQLSATPNEVVLTNQAWSHDLMWGSDITINNIYQYLPAGVVFRAYIRRDNSTNWEELIMDDYNSYYGTSLFNGNLSLWSTDDETDTPDIKLVY
jgi:hypothetical protein